MASPPVYALLYRSVASPQLTRDGLLDVVRTSLRANARAGVTGLLLYGGDPDRLGTVAELGGPFVQWLEGPEEAVRATYERVCGDDCHTHCDVLAEGPAADLVGHDGRLFLHWSMAYERPGALPTTPEGVLAYARAHARRHGAGHPLRWRPADSRALSGPGWSGHGQAAHRVMGGGAAASS